MRPGIQSRRLPGPAILLVAALAAPCRGEALPIVETVEYQPLTAQVRRVIESLEALGQPLPEPDRARIDRAIASADQARAVRALQQVLDEHCLIGITINPESRVKAVQGPAAPQLVEGGWRVFLVKVQNEAGVTAALEAESPNAAPVYKRSNSSPAPKPTIPPAEIPQRWMDLAF